MKNIIDAPRYSEFPFDDKVWYWSEIFKERKEDLDPGENIFSQEWYNAVMSHE